MVWLDQLYLYHFPPSQLSSCLPAISGDGRACQRQIPSWGWVTTEPTTILRLQATWNASDQPFPYSVIKPIIPKPRASVWLCLFRDSLLCRGENYTQTEIILVSLQWLMTPLLLSSLKQVAHMLVLSLQNVQIEFYSKCTCSEQCTLSQQKRWDLSTYHQNTDKTAKYQD